MKRVLVFGGTGFIGHHVVRAFLDAGYPVRVLARPGGDRSLLQGLAAEVVDGDLRNRGDIIRSLEGCDGVVHAAAHYPIYSISRDEELRLAVEQINLVQDALAERQLSRFVYISSLSAVGKYRDGRPEDENAPYPKKRNRSTYCLLKRAMQDEVLRRAGEFNSVVVAPTGVFGEGDRKPTSGRMLLMIAKGFLPAVLSGKTNIVDVHDVARGVVAAFEKGKTGRVYVLGGENMTNTEFVRRVARIAGARAPRLVLPPQLLLPVAYIAEAVDKTLGVSIPRLPLVAIYFVLFGEYLSSDVAKKEIGYEPHPVDPAIERALDWFRAHGYL